MNLFVIFACEKGFVSFHLLQRISRLFYDTMKKLIFTYMEVVDLCLR